MGSSLGCTRLSWLAPSTLLLFHLLTFPLQPAAGTCIEEVAFYSKFINRKQLLALAEKLEKSGYGEYLKRAAR